MSRELTLPATLSSSSSPPSSSPSCYFLTALVPPVPISIPKWQPPPGALTFNFYESAFTPFKS